VVGYREMQYLISALPGIRDVRGSAIAGYLWIIFGWLVVRPNIDHRPNNPLGAALFDLGHHVGRVAVGVAISIVAYFLGDLSESLSSVVGTAWGRLATETGIWGPYSSFRFVTSIVQREVNEANRRSHIHPDELEGHANDLTRELEQELSLPATLLVEPADQQLYRDADRLRAEGRLRLAIVPPLVALLVLLVIESRPAWLFATPLIMALFWEGVKRQADSKKLIADAITDGRFSAPSVRRFKEWATSPHPSVDEPG
jgi:hypothetical protein